MKLIHGKPEGRPGVWLIDPDTAAQLIEDVEGDTVHNILGDALFIGCDWPKKDAVFLMNSGLRLALIFPPNVVMRHHLVALSDEKRYAFDVGAISEERMTQCTCGEDDGTGPTLPHKSFCPLYGE